MRALLKSIRLPPPQTHRRDSPKLPNRTTALSKLRQSSHLLRCCTLVLVPAFAALPVTVSSNPSGANVVHGAATFNGLGTSGLTINQTSGTAIINWQDFSVGAGEWTRFVQPGSDSLAINRVISGNPSAIYGSLSANGNVTVINPNGIVVGASGVIDVAGAMTLSTLDASNNDLLDRGTNRYFGNSNAGVTNYGSVSAGDVVILGNFMSNHGSIVADRSIAIGAGGDILVNQTLDGATISVRSGGPGGATGIENSGDIAGGSVALKAHGNSYAMAINNTGTGNIRARGYNYRGGILTLHAGRSGGIINTGNLYARQQQTGKGGRIHVEGGNVNLKSGRIDASGFVSETGGSIAVDAADLNVGANALLISDGVDGGSIKLEGRDSATLAGRLSARSYIGNGGAVDFTSAGSVQVESSASVNVTGMGGAGGEVRIGGGYQGAASDITNASSTTIEDGALIIADGLGRDGGEVVIWSDGDTMFSGEVSAQALGSVGNGGLVEVSGADQLTFRGKVSTLANNGETGVLLLDPTDITIVDGAGAAGTMTEAGINSALLSNNLIIHTGAAGTDTGNILVENDVRIEWGNPNSDSTSTSGQNYHSLTLLANGDITVEGHIISHGMGNVNLFAGWDGVSGNPSNTGPVDIAALRAFGTPGSGSVRINDQGNDQAVQVGSRFGETNVIGHDVILQVPSSGDDRFAQVGYRATTHVESGGAGIYGLVNSSTFRQGLNGTATGSIDLRGTAFGNAVVASGVSGNINIEAQRNVFLLGRQGEASDNYTQIGHGGNVYATGTGDAIDFSIIDADHSGDIAVTAGIGAASAIVLQAGQERGYSRIGHGGLSNPDGGPAVGGVNEGGASALAHGAGAFQGDIHVRNNNGTILARGNDGGGWAGFTQIGHGGYRNARTYEKTEGIDTIRDGNDVADVLDDARNLDTALGPRAFDPDLLTPDGNPLGDRGNITVEAESGSVIFLAGNTSRSGAILGHGGHERPGNIGLFDANGEVIERADITVTADHILFGNQVDTDDQRYVKLGHAGYQSPGNAAGNIDVTSRVGSISFEGGENEGYAHLGHGGFVRTWNAGNQGVAGSLRGDITVQSAADIVFRSGGEVLGANSGADRAFSQIGHGGFGWTAISQAPNELLHGHSGDIVVSAAGKIDFMSGQPDENMSAGNSSYSMIGHGGYSSRGDHWGKIDVSSGTGVRFEAVGGWDSVKSDGTAGDARGDTNFVQIGHGGRANDFEENDARGGVISNRLGGSAGSNRDSSISVTALSGDIEMIAPQKTTIDHQLALIQNPTDASSRWADEDDARFSHYAVRSWAKIGHTDVDGSNYRLSTASEVGDGSGVLGDITVNASAGAVRFVGSQLKQAFSNDTRNADATRDAFSSRRSEQNFTGVGHGGITMRGVKSGDITVMARDDILIEGGMGRHDHSHIGHGGWDNDGAGGNNGALRASDSHDGSITVLTSAGSIDLLGGNGGATKANIDAILYTYAQIGHGGRSSNGSVKGGDDHITVRAGGGDLNVHAGFGFAENFALIGHGGHDSRAQEFNGNIDTYALNNISLRGTESGYNQVSNFAQIGHGGWNVDIELSNNDLGNDGLIVVGDISAVAATGDITMAAGVDNISVASGGANNFRYEGDAAPNTGFGGTSSDGYMYAGVDTAADVNVRSQGGWTRIGHGGQHTNITARDEDITVVAGGNLVGVAGEFRDAMVQVGHGGGPDSWGGNRARRRTIAIGDIDITVGNDMSLFAGSGDNAAVKIGNGEYQPTSDRNRTEVGTDGRGRTTTWSGDIHVKVGNDLVLDADETINPAVAIVDGQAINALGLRDTYAGGLDMNRVLIGHRDSNDSRANHTGVESTGNTFIAVSRNNPDFIAGGSGEFITRVSAGNPNGVAISSGGNGLEGDLRLYMPNRPQNLIQAGTLLNAAVYSDPDGQAAGSRSAVSLLANDNRSDENLDYYEHQFGSTGTPSGTFSPEGPYAVVNGLGDFYQIYYNNVSPTVTTPNIGGPGNNGGAATTTQSVSPPPPVPFDYTAFVGDEMWEAYDWPYGLLEFDGYNNLLEGLSPRAIVDSADNYIPRSGLEEALDAAFGRRRWTWRPGGEDYFLSSEGSFAASSDYAKELNEDNDRIRERALRGIGKGENTFFLYEPSTNRYSSMRMFGYPTADIPAFQPGQ